jgi:flagellar M-ring protein FliF
MNQNLSKLLGQLRDIWNQLGPSQRLNVAAATLVLVAGLGAMALWSSRVDYGLLYGGLSDSEASKVIAALDDAKVPYKTGSGGSILVPSDKVYAMRMQLAGRGIPSGDGVGFEIFDKANFGISDFVQRANYTRAIEGELARTISQIDEVASARVMIVMPENRLLLDKDTFPTASVFVHVRGTAQLEPQSINSIRFLVANSVEGLKPNHVSVVDNLGNVLSENTDDDSLTGLTSTQLAARRNLEQYLAKKAQDMMDKVLGPGQAIVRVSADINYDTVTRSDEKYDPDGQVIKTQTKDDQTTESSTTANTTPAGITANTLASTNSAAGSSAPLNNTQDHKTTSTVEYDVGVTTSSLVQAAGGIKRLTASVSIAAVEQGTGDQRKVVPRTSDQLDKLRSIVASAVGIDTTRGDTIALEELPFNDDFATEVTHDLDQQQKQDFWWDLARNATYPVLAVGVFLVLLRLLSRTPVQDIPLGVPVGRLLSTHNGNGHGNGNGNGNGHGQLGKIGDAFEAQPGVVTVEVLNRLIKENPVNMTQAIRDWMNKGRTTEQN